MTDPLPGTRLDLILRWIGLCALAELLGIGAASIWYGSINWLYGEPGPFLPRVLVWLLMSLAAVPEGIILGGLQARGIRWFLPEVSTKRLILATVAIGLLGWGVGTFIPMFLMVGDTAQPSAGTDLWATAGFAATFGLGVGLVFGLAQSWALPTAIGGKALWSLANMVGWAFGLPLIYVGAEIGADFTSWIPRIAVWAAGGLAAGAVIGLSTGLALAMMPENRRAARASNQR